MSSDRPRLTALPRRQSTSPETRSPTGRRRAAAGAGKASDDLVALGVRLREIRRQRKLSQERLAAEIGVKTGTYATWERGAFSPRLDKLAALARHLDVSTDFLLGRGEGETPSVSVNGATWRLTWSRPSPDRELGAAIWQRLVSGESPSDIAEGYQFNTTVLERRLQDVVLGESLIVESVERSASLERRLRQRFVDDDLGVRLREVRVAKLGDIRLPLVRYVLLGHVARTFFTDEVAPGNSIGLCGGFAVSRMVHALQRGEVPGGVRVFPIAVTPVFEKATVSANANVSALAYRHFDYGVQAAELPFVSDEIDDSTGFSLSPPLRIARRILGDAARVDFVFMGIGSRETGALATDIAEVRRDYQWLGGVNIGELERSGQHVGDVLYHLVDAQGEPLAGFKEQNERLVCSIGLEGLRALVESGKRVAAIASGANKVDVTRAAIVGGYVNVLIVDDELASGLLEEPRPAVRPGRRRTAPGSG